MNSPDAPPNARSRMQRELERLSAPDHTNLSELQPELDQALETVRRYLPSSPLRRSDWLSSLCGGEVWLKMENLNPTGSFKVRGALNAVARRLHRSPAGSQFLGEAEAVTLVAASAGNHAQGVAFAAREMGCAAHIFLPHGTPLVKQLQTKRLGATISVMGQNLNEAFEHAFDYVDKNPGSQFLHPFNDFEVIAGQATCLMESFRQYEEVTGRSRNDIERFVCSVGGGGLVSGSGLAMALGGKGEVVGVEHESFDSAHASLSRGQWSPISQEGSTSLADGIRVQRIGRQNLALMKETVAAVGLVSDDELAGAITSLFENENVVAEGAGAAAVAHLLQRPQEYSGRCSVLCLSGGNIDAQLFSRALSRGLRLSARVMRVKIHIGDKPGQLAQALCVLAESDANLLEVHHDRTYSKVNVGHVEVELSVETRDTAHQEAVMHQLQIAGLRPESH